MMLMKYGKVRLKRGGGGVWSGGGQRSKKLKT